MKTPRFSGPFKWSALRQQLLSLREDIQSIQKVAGRNVTVSEHPGKGTVINAGGAETRLGGGGVCCAAAVCSITDEASCVSGGGTFYPFLESCTPDPCNPCTSGAFPSTVTYSYDFLAKGAGLTCVVHAIDSGSITNSDTNLIANYNGDDPTVIGPCFIIGTPCAGPINCLGTDYWFQLDIEPFFDSFSDCWSCDFAFKFYSNSGCTSTFFTYVLNEEQVCNAGHDIRTAAAFTDVIDYPGLYQMNCSVQFS